MYRHYKPLRNKLREHKLLEILTISHAFLQWMQFNQPLPAALRDVRLNRDAPGRGVGLTEWEVDILVREALLHSPINGTRSAARWASFAELINQIKKIEDVAWAERIDQQDDDIWWELYRIAHRQFPWQTGVHHATILRNFKLFSHPEMRPLFEGAHGMTPVQFYQIGLGLSGHFMRQARITKPVRNAINRVPAQALSQFLQRASDDVSGFQNRITATQSYNENWAYTFSELRRTPLVSFGNDHDGFYMCPSVTYIIRHITDGVFYTLVGADGFANAFGNSFQNYVGEVLRASFTENATVLEEQQYGPRRARKRSVDWIVDGPDAALFIECKARRAHMDTRTKLQATSAIEADLDSMSTSLAQLYKTLSDAINGHYEHWQIGERIPFPVLVTLEDWYGFGHIQGQLSRRTKEKLEETNHDSGLVETYPYTLCSVEELEIASQIMNRRGILEFMSGKTEGEHRAWLLSAFASNYYQGDLGNLQDLFSETWREIERV